MGVSYRELRRVCQAPVRHSNDVAGLLFGDFASLPITKFFVDLRLSPDYASVGFFLCGLVGAALGVLGAIGATQFLTQLLFQVEPTDLVTYGVVIAAAVLVGVLAAWLPARRATRIDPVSALRHE